MKDFEWCTGCKEYDHEKHCCPRWTKVIRTTLNDNINAVLDEIRSEIEKVVWEDVVVSLDGTDEVRIPRLDPDDVFEIIDKHRAESVEGEQK